MYIEEKDENIKEKKGKTTTLDAEAAGTIDNVKAKNQGTVNSVHTRYVGNTAGTPRANPGRLKCWDSRTRAGARPTKLQNVSRAEFGQMKNSEIIGTYQQNSEAELQTLDEIHENS